MVLFCQRISNSDFARAFQYTINLQVANGLSVANFNFSILHDQPTLSVRTLFGYQKQDISLKWPSAIIMSHHYNYTLYRTEPGHLW